MSGSREGGCACGAVRYRLWVTLPDSVPASNIYYDTSKLWPAASLERLEALAASARTDG
jgi:hypothetical protein